MFDNEAPVEMPDLPLMWRGYGQTERVLPTTPPQSLGQPPWKRPRTRKFMGAVVHRSLGKLLSSRIESMGELQVANLREADAKDGDGVFHISTGAASGAN